MIVTQLNEAAEVLRVQSLSVHRGTKVVLQGLDYTIPSRGIHVIMGAGGGGKSTFLQVLCDPNHISIRAKVSGEVFYKGARLGEADFPEMVIQQGSNYQASAREFLMEGHPDRNKLLRIEQLKMLGELCKHYDFADVGEKLDQKMIHLKSFERRVILIVKGVLKNPALLCLDEPLRGFEGEAADRIIKMIRILGHERSVILITHHHMRAEMLGDTVTLLTRSRLEGHTDVVYFFRGAGSRIIENFLRTGGSSLLNPPQVIDQGAVYWSPEALSPPRDASFPLPTFLPSETQNLQEESAPPPDENTPAPLDEWEDGELLLTLESDEFSGLDDDLEGMQSKLQKKSLPKSETPKPLFSGETSPQDTSPQDTSPQDTSPQEDPLKTNPHQQNPSQNPSVEESTPAPEPALPRDFKHRVVPIDVLMQGPLQVPAASRGPRGFRWVVPGILGGSPRPGLLHDISDELNALKRMKMTHLITLTQTPPDTKEIHAAGLRSSWFAIVDMETPTFEEAEEHFREIEAAIDAGEVIVYHCRAGLGRTGLMLAGYLIWKSNIDGAQAIEITRRAERAYIQSKMQENFLHEFAEYCAKISSD